MILVHLLSLNEALSQLIRHLRLILDPLNFRVKIKLMLFVTGIKYLRFNVVFQGELIRDEHLLDLIFSQ